MSSGIIHFQIKFGVWDVEAISKKYKIKIVANAPREKFMDLQFVTPQGRIYHDYEALQGDLSIALYERQALGSQWVLKTKLNSHQAGIEYGSFLDLGSKNNFETMNLCLMGCH